MMKKLLVEKEIPADHVHTSRHDIDRQLRSVFQGIDRRYRYTKMAERIYGEPGAADRLLLKALYLSQTMEPSGKDPLRDNMCLS